MFKGLQDKMVLVYQDDLATEANQAGQVHATC